MVHGGTNRKANDRLLPAIVVCLSTMLAGINAASTVTRIMPLGDSITQADFEHASYRRPLWKKLKEAGYEVDFVGSMNTHFQKSGYLEVEPPYSDFDTDHEGHFGWRADQLADSLPRWLTGYMPDIVIMQAGHNDVKDTFALEEIIRQTLGDYATAINSLRERNPEVTILLSTAILSHPTLDIYSRAPKLEGLNKHIPAFADSFSSAISPIYVVHTDKLFNPEIHTQPDGVHPNEEGERVIAEALFNALRGHLEQQNTVSVVTDYQSGAWETSARPAQEFLVNLRGRILPACGGKTRRPVFTCAIRIEGAVCKGRIE